MRAHRTRNSAQCARMQLNTDYWLTARRQREGEHSTDAARHATAVSTRAYSLWEHRTDRNDSLTAAAHSTLLHGAAWEATAICNCTPHHIPPASQTDRQRASAARTFISEKLQAILYVHIGVSRRGDNAAMPPPAFSHIQWSIRPHSSLKHHTTFLSCLHAALKRNMAVLTTKKIQVL